MQYAVNPELLKGRMRYDAVYDVLYEYVFRCAFRPHKGLLIIQSSPFTGIILGSLCKLPLFIITSEGNLTYENNCKHYCRNKY